MNELILDISFIRACLFKAGSERTRKILEADLQKLEEERDQIMRNFAAHLKELRKQRLRRRWPRCTITTLNQLRRTNYMHNGKYSVGSPSRGNYYNIRNVDL